MALVAGGRGGPVVVESSLLSSGGLARRGSSIERPVSLGRDEPNGFKKSID
jgi:hypothetical protein